MFVRKKRNKSGSVSIQIIDKTNGYKVIRTVGTADNPEEIERLWKKGLDSIHPVARGQQQLFSMQAEVDVVVENFVDDLSNTHIRTIGPELIFGTLFNRLGFNAIEDELFRHIVIARLAYPTSKLKTVDYLQRYRGITVGVQTIYRFLDTLNVTYKDTVERIAYEQTKRTVGAISVVFYDMTTLYFESEDEDDLRKIGFSKEGKFQHPQIMLGLLVGTDGLPIGYDIFEGNTFEGHTLLPMLDRIQKKYGFGKPVVVADAGLLSNENIKKLTGKKYQYIIGGRIRNESENIRAGILNSAKERKDGDSFEFRKPDGTRLIVTYTDKRAKKDKYNREKGLKKLRQRVRSGTITKDSINNRGYNKFLALKGELLVTIDEDKVAADEKWDGLKGYITNTELAATDVVENYRNLWQIEKAFRISKTDLRVRPIHHYRKRRIEAHICIAFVAYAIYKALEQQLEKCGVNISTKRATELTHTMYQLHYRLPSSNEEKQKILNMDNEQKILYEAILK